MVVRSIQIARWWSLAVLSLVVADIVVASPSIAGLQVGIGFRSGVGGALPSILMALSAI